MEVTKDRAVCRQKMSEWGADQSISRVGALGLNIKEADVRYFNPTDFLTVACTYLSQFFDKFILYFLSEPTIFPVNRADLVVPDYYDSFTATQAYNKLEPLIGDVCDYVYFDELTLGEARAIHDHLSRPSMITAAGFLAPQLVGMECTVRFANTFDHLARNNKFYLIDPKQITAYGSGCWLLSNMIQSNGETIVLPQTIEGPDDDYGKMIVAPHMRNSDGTPGNLIGMPNRSSDILLSIKEQMDEITLADLTTMDMQDLMHIVDDAVDNLDCGWTWAFHDFERSLITRSYIPRKGALQIQFSWMLRNVGDPVGNSVSDFYYIGNNANRFWDLRSEADFSGMPTGPSDIDNFSRPVTDTAIWSSLPTERTTGPINPIRVF